MSLVSSAVLLLISGDNVMQPKQCGIKQQGDTDGSRMACEHALRGQPRLWRVVQLLKKGILSQEIAPFGMCAL